MEIFINDEKLDFTLEHENTLGQVIDGIEAWLSKSGLLITSIMKDSLECLSTKREEWEDSEISSVGNLVIGVKSAIELHISTCENILTFLALLKRAIEQTDNSLIAELKTGFPFVVESLGLLTSKRLFPIGPELAEFEQMGYSLLSGDTGLQSEDTINLIERLEEKVTSLYAELKYPFESLRRIASELKASIGEISNVSILLQTGKDKKAFDAIIRFSELFSSLLRVFSYIKTEQRLDLGEFAIGKGNLEEYYNNLNTALKELNEAFTINDFVLIGDLLEYEIAPKIEELIVFIENFEDMAQGSA